MGNNVAKLKRFKYSNVKGFRGQKSNLRNEFKDMECIFIYA